MNNYHEIQPDSPGAYDIVATWSTINGPVAGKLRVAYQGAEVNTRMTIQPPKGSLSGNVSLQEMGGPPVRILTGAEISIGPEIAYFARSGPDGGFKLPAVYAGRYQLGAVRGLPPDSYVVSVSQGGRDLFRDNLVVENKETAIEVVVSTGAGIVEGKVLNDGGQPVHNALVALVPESPLKERTDYYGAFQETRSDQNGAFDIHDLTPGSYQAYAWVDAPAGAFRNDAFMKAYVGKGTLVAIEVGDRVRVELKALEAAP